MQALLDDQSVKAASMCASPLIGPLAGPATAWAGTLDALQDLVDSWVACQSTWQYLEPVFASPDILKQMPEEGDKFLEVHAFAPGPVAISGPSEGVQQ